MVESSSDSPSHSDLAQQVRQVVHKMNNLLTALNCRIELLPNGMDEAREQLLQLAEGIRLETNVLAVLARAETKP